MYITKINHLVSGREYRIFNVAGESKVVIFHRLDRGYVSAEETAVFIAPESGIELRWSESTFARAVDDKAVQTRFELFCLHTAQEINQNGKTFMEAVEVVQSEHQSFAGVNCIKILRDSAQTFHSFYENVYSRVVIKPNTVREGR